MDTTPFISIIIPVRNGERLLANCLESLKLQSYPHDRFEIIISDGMSSDDTIKIAEKYGAKVVRNPKLTVGPGRNEGYKLSRGDLIAFSDDDCVMDKDWLLNSVKYFKDERVGGLSGPTITQNDGSPLGEAIGLIYDLAASSGKSAHRSENNKVSEVADIPGCNAIYRRTVIEEVFPIDETLITAEDVEMNRLIRLEGHKLLYVPDVKLWHNRRQNLMGFYKQMYRFAIGRLQVGRKDLKMLTPTHILAGITLPVIILLLLALYFSNNIRTIYYFSWGIPFLAIIAAVFAFFKTGAIKPAIVFPFVVITFIVAWSLGFMRELFFPI
ncbi:glycosyltransferase [Candidatus Saganbacteria bacterium]|nr:glycosyltransferase [Candidatus Saganbacteria bacterium]